MKPIKATWWSRSWVVVLVTAGLLAAGCDRDGITTYTVPKEAPLARLPADADAGHAAHGAPARQVTWQTPGGWQELPAGQMRVGSFQVEGEGGQKADVSVIPLGGRAGGALDNVNRWRAQVGQGPVDAAALVALAQPVEVDGQPASLYEAAGTGGGDAPTRILAAIHQREGMAWFFKMTGPSALVAREKPAFVAFLKSVRFAAAPAAAPAAPAAAAGAGDGRPRWQVPAGWATAPAGQFLVAKFTIGEGGGAAAVVNVSSSAGDGGGLAANVNRWRQQLGLGEATAGEITASATRLATGGGEGTLVELAGRDARSGESAALVGVMVARPGQAWFYKLVGDPGVVAAQKAAFTRFVEGVQY